MKKRIEVYGVYSHNGITRVLATEWYGIWVISKRAYNDAMKRLRCIGGDCLVSTDGVAIATAEELGWE